MDSSFLKFIKCNKNLLNLCEHNLNEFLSIWLKNDNLRVET